MRIDFEWQGGMISLVLRGGHVWDSGSTLTRMFVVWAEQYIVDGVLGLRCVKTCGQSMASLRTEWMRRMSQWLAMMMNCGSCSDLQVWLKTPRVA